MKMKVVHGFLAFLLLSGTVFAAVPNDNALPKPDVLVGAQLQQPIVHAARLYAAFWNTGNPEYARAALSSRFIDQTPPPGRKPGLNGVLEASHNFRTAVPDLSTHVEHILVAGDYVTVRYRFMGHFTGTMGKQKGWGQLVDFKAVDVYRVQDGRITDNWHLEDYKTLFDQIAARQQ